MINGNYLSLDNILTIAISIASPSFDFFTITYHSGKEVSFYLTPHILEDGVLSNFIFNFKHKETFDKARNEILKILTEYAAPTL